MKNKKVALVVGANGIIGRNLAEHLVSTADWEVVVTSQKPLDYSLEAKFVQMDLLQENAVAEAAKELANVTHVFYAAYIERKTLAEQTETNTALLENLVLGLEQVAEQFKHITFIQGGKAYGAHLGIYKTPALETDRRHFPPNFYYNQEDFLRKQSEGKNWNWTAVRPDIIIGYAIGNPMNMANLIAVYAALCKELNVPFRFPGSPKAYEVLVNITDVNILAQGMDFVARNETCYGEIFNVTNGDVFRWKQVWAAFAEYFDVEYDEPQTFFLAEYMQDKEAVWKEMKTKYNLTDYSIKELANWGFGDFIFNVQYDAFFDVNKLRRIGFSQMHKPSLETFIAAFDQLKLKRIIP